MTDLTGEIRDFVDTAALISGLDLVISVDTAVVHLAGALGKPVWALLQYAPDWRWYPDEAGSVWYPTLRMYRQQRRGDWPGVIARVTRDLRAMSGAATSPT
jgi:ADP-heptose:LPS heptosyltransferase